MKKIFLLLLILISFSFHLEQINFKKSFFDYYFFLKKKNIIIFNNFSKKILNFLKKNTIEKKNENFLFKKGVYYFNHSLDFDLDQTNTDLSIKIFNQFIKEYPNHIKIKEANKFLKILLKKIEKRDYYIANTYYLMNEYKASLMYFKNFIINYPNSILKENVLYKICLNTYQLVNSSKKKNIFF
ncbi:outer membrane protein assembly factor BamD [Blattabacterium cuenoti]|uniref:outer membrane protein assembly factor BamD n=1 Tax=Blattabacterium cuenoti TaxID=1653831 RepID=UPI00163B7386|nr:outer membrane protein assembly factor BamD [Blattabacterium cuenoti]